MPEPSEELLKRLEEFFRKKHATLDALAERQLGILRLRAMGPALDHRVLREEIAGELAKIRERLDELQAFVSDRLVDVDPITGKVFGSPKLDGKNLIGVSRFRALVRFLTHFESLILRLDGSYGKSAARYAYTAAIREGVETESIRPITKADTTFSDLKIRGMLIPGLNIGEWYVASDISKPSLETLTFSYQVVHRDYVMRKAERESVARFHEREITHRREMVRASVSRGQFLKSFTGMFATFVPANGDPRKSEYLEVRGDGKLVSVTLFTLDEGLSGKVFERGMIPESIFRKIVGGGKTATDHDRRRGKKRRSEKAGKKPALRLIHHKPKTGTDG